MNLTDLLAMPLIHTDQARSMGTVMGFALHDLIVTHYLVVDDAYSEEQAYPFGDVHVGEDALCTLASGSVPPQGQVPFRCPVYTADGKRLGILDEIEVSHDGKIRNITVGQEKIPCGKIAAIEDVVIVKSKKQTSPAPSSSRRGRAKKSTLSDEGQAPDRHEDAAQNEPSLATQKSAVTILEQSAQNAEEGKLRRIIGNYSFLLGRILQEDLVQEGRVLLPKGIVLTDGDVAKAWRNGLLVALTQLSRA